MSIYFITHGSWWFHSSPFFPIWIHSQQWRSTEPACERFEVRQVVAPKVCAPAFLTNTAYQKSADGLCVWNHVTRWEQENPRIYIYINNRYNIFQWSIYRCCNKHSYRVNSKHVQNFHIKNAIGQTGQTSVKLLLATWVILAQPWNNNFWNPFAVCGIWCLSHNHTLILISSWIRYYYILTNFVYASLLNQLETSDTHTSAYHHRRQQGLGSTFPSEGKDK